VLTDFARRVESRVGSPVPSGDGSRRRSAASRRCALPFGAGTGAGAVIISTVVSEVLDIFQASQGSLGHFVGRSGLCLHYHLPSAGGYVPATPADRVCVGCRVPPSRRARSWSRAYIITISLRSRLGHSGLGYFRGLGETPQPAETWVWARSAHSQARAARAEVSACHPSTPIAVTRRPIMSEKLFDLAVFQVSGFWLSSLTHEDSAARGRRPGICDPVVRCITFATTRRPSASKYRMHKKLPE
jgi:hypothetical protein